MTFSGRQEEGRKTLPNGDLLSFVFLYVESYLVYYRVLISVEQGALPLDQGDVATWRVSSASDERIF